MILKEGQKILLGIVQTWRLSEKPEYRGFRCANCQQYINKAWYYWLKSKGYKLYLHMCNDICELALKNKSIIIKKTERHTFGRNTFTNSFTYPKKAIKRFGEIVSSWLDDEKPNFRAFTCDACEKALVIDKKDGLRKGYHIWWKMDDKITLAELHFHKKCAEQLGIKAN